MNSDYLRLIKCGSNLIISKIQAPTFLIAIESGVIPLLTHNQLLNRPLVSI